MKCLDHNEQVTKTSSHILYPVHFSILTRFIMIIIDIKNPSRLKKLTRPSNFRNGIRATPRALQPCGLNQSISTSLSPHRPNVLRPRKNSLHSTITSIMMKKSKTSQSRKTQFEAELRKRDNLSWTPSHYSMGPGVMVSTAANIDPASTDEGGERVNRRKKMRTNILRKLMKERPKKDRKEQAGTEKKQSSENSDERRNACEVCRKGEQSDENLNARRNACEGCRE